MHFLFFTQGLKCRIIHLTIDTFIMKENTPADFFELRQKAEEYLANHPLSPVSNLTEVQLLKLTHELHVHQIELEMQNEELIQAKKQAISDMENFVNLYDFVPSGIITLSDKGIILNLNRLAAKLLCNDRRSLKNTPFIHYIHPKGIMLYNQLFNTVFVPDSKKVSELFLLSNTGTPTCVHIDTIACKKNKQFSITMYDITDYKRQEEEAKIKLNDLKEINNYFHYRELKLMDIKDEVNALLIIAGCEEQYLI